MSGNGMGRPRPTAVGGRPGGERTDELARNAVIARLYDDHHRSLVRYLSFKLGNREDAAEAAQEVFCRVTAAGHLNGRAPAYLFTTARNLVFDIMKSRRARNTYNNVDIDGLDDFELACDAPSPEWVAFSRQEYQILLKAVEELRPRPRRVFVMRRFGEAGYEEIAEELGLTLWTVKDYMKEALRHIRRRVIEARQAGGQHAAAQLPAAE